MSESQRQGIWRQEAMDLSAMRAADVWEVVQIVDTARPFVVTFGNGITRAVSRDELVAILSRE